MPLYPPQARHRPRRAGPRQRRARRSTSPTVSIACSMPRWAGSASASRRPGWRSPISIGRCIFCPRPEKLAQLREKALRKAIRLGNYALRHGADPDYPPCILPLPQDRRFAGEAWRRWPFNLIYQGFLLNQQWWHSATTGIGGVSRHHEQMVSFASRQWLDMASPVNFVAANPDVLETTWRENGQNLVRGAINFAEDWERAMGGKPPIGAEAFEPGENIAVTKGAV